MPHYSRRPFNPGRLHMQTQQAKRRIASAVDYAKRLLEDPECAERQRQQLCVACYYTQRLAGQAVSTQPCACCATLMEFASTNTDALCKPCATEHKLCKHCSGDITMNAARRQWPTGPSNAEAPCDR